MDTAGSEIGPRKRSRSKKARMRRSGKKRLGKIPQPIPPVDLAVKRAEKKKRYRANREQRKNRENEKKMEAIEARRSVLRESGYLFTKEKIDRIHKNLNKSRELQREALREGAKRGWSKKEFTICGSFLYKRDFEKKSILSAEEREWKAYLDLVRDTKGYGVDVLPPDYDPDDPYAESHLNPQTPCWEICPTSLSPQSPCWETCPTTQTFVKKLQEMALLKIEEGFGKTYHIDDLEFVNLVQKGYHHLLTFKLPTDQKGGDREVVETICFARTLMDMEFDEVKIRKGSKLLFSSVEVTLSGYPIY